VRDRPTPERVREAEQHVSRCSDCWAVLSHLHERATGAPPLESERMEALYGCDGVRDRLYLLVDLGAEGMRQQHPDVAAHLGWCHACRGRFVEMRAVERGMARGEFGEPIAAPVLPRWKEVAGAVGETVREAVGQLLVQLREGAAILAGVPEGLVPMPALATGGGVRGAPELAGRGREDLAGREVQFALPDMGASVELRLQAQGRERLAIELRLVGADTGSLAVSLRAVRADGSELVASQTVRPGRPVVLAGVLPDQYLLEIQDRSAGRRFRIRLGVEPA